MDGEHLDAILHTSYCGHVSLERRLKLKSVSNEQYGVQER